MRLEVRFAGFGGQGIVLSGVILGKAASIYENKFAVQTQSYGPESRGGAACSEVIISDIEIYYPKAIDSNILVAMSQTAYDRFKKNVQYNGKILIDPDLITISPEDQEIFRSKGIELYGINSTHIAEKIGNIIVANIVMLGALVTLSGIVSEDAIKNAVLDSIPKKTKDMNLMALEEGFKLGKIASKY